jgi:hypothetical protein
VFTMYFVVFTVNILSNGAVFIIQIEIRGFLACLVAVAVITKLGLINKWLGSLAYHYERLCLGGILNF